MNGPKQLCLAAMLLLMISCSKKDEILTSEKWFLKGLGGKENINQIASAQRMVVWRTAGEDNSENWQGYWKKTGKGVVADSELLARVKQTLLNTNSYCLDPKECGSMCMMEPGVVVALESRTETNDVWICFKCAQIEIDTASTTNWTMTLDFGPSYREFARVMKTLFPGDPKIQALKD